MEAKDTIKINGRLRVRTYDAAGNLIDDWTGKNLVVDLGITNVCALLAGDAANGLPIATYQAGTNGTAPAAGDVAITASFTKDIAGYTYPNSNEVNFNFTMELVENNGMTIAEYGLIDGTGKLFSRLTKPPQLKTGALRLVGDWTFTYTN